MTSYFADIPSFTSWLETKTETELKSKLFRADLSARLNGSKPALVRRLVEATRHLGQEREGCIFPELRRRRQQDHLARIDITRQRVRTAQRNFMAQASLVAGREAPAREQHRRPAAQEARPVRNLAGNSTAARPVPIFPVPILHNTPMEPSIPPPVTQHLPEEERDLTPLRTGLRNPRNILAELPGNVAAGRTPEQVLRGILEVQAGLIIQSISEAVTPRPRHNSMSRMGEAATGADSPKPNQSRAASTSSAEKRGPEVSMEDKYQVKLECKICYDSSVNTVLLPCGHACCCQDCSVRLQFATWDTKCPICRKRVQSISMLYFS
eukprot:GFUD01068137.1.p1 GENE.GFUD01068137.1~~GFUD01068137.1.p1  ORF type:complete len:324 (-),score=85.88 GFUD01068137.1:475-1446(-)